MEGEGQNFKILFTEEILKVVTTHMTYLARRRFWRSLVHVKLFCLMRLVFLQVRILIVSREVKIPFSNLNELRKRFILGNFENKP